MVRTMLNVALNCMIPTLAGGRTAMDTTQSPQLVPQSDLESYIPKM
jgi:hypothetical protein